ncbi:hypothetical protein ACLPJK_26460 [Pseudomonas aeruginosa]|uniref:hypothetical protein n=1 Tax=Pseudomonas aeruginosa TaxID=287 RepID=UPI003D2B2C37
MKYVILVLALLLAGCGKTTTFIPLPDKRWLDDCPIVPPPEREKFLKLNPVRKVEELTMLKIAQDRENSLCNQRLAKARAFFEQMQKRYAPTPGK